MRISESSSSKANGSLSPRTALGRAWGALSSVPEEKSASTILREGDKWFEIETLDLPSSGNNTPSEKTWRIDSRLEKEKLQELTEKLSSLLEEPEESTRNIETL